MSAEEQPLRGAVADNGENEPLKDNKRVLEQKVNFAWENLTYKVPVMDAEGNTTYKTLLYSLSGCATGGRVLAIMGPSGAGKTTLMGAITGKLYNPTAILEGCCFMNNNIYTERYKRLVSYVSQDDIVMGKDTPREAIEFACRVRYGMTTEETHKAADELIGSLHMEGCQHTLLGVPGLIKGVSGGERKRANIATELITNPYVMLLDEPTTGLDSVNALRVGQLLRQLAGEGRTVIATVHSPSSELVDVFDDILLLAKGHVIYHGPTAESTVYFAKLGYTVPPFMNPTEYYMNLLQLPEDILSQLWLAWEDYVMSPEAESNPCLTTVQGPITVYDPFLEEQLKLKGGGLGIQLLELIKRSWRMYLRDPGQYYSRSFQTLYFAIFIGLFYFNLQLNDSGVKDREGCLYFILMNNLMSSSLSGVAAFPPERAVFLQEQANDAYNAYIYALAKNIAELPWEIGFPTVFVVVAYFMLHLYRSAGAFFVTWFILVLLTNVGYSMGLMFATFFAESTTVFALIPVILLPLLVVSGLFANTSRLDPYWIWLNYISFPRHAYLGVFNNEFSRLSVICNPVSTTCIYPNGEAVIEQMGFVGWSYWKTFVALIVYQLGFRIIAAISLASQGRARRGRLNYLKNLEKRVASPRAIASARSNDGLSGSETLLDEIQTPSIAYTN